MSDVRAFLAAQPKKKLVEMLYDLVMDCTEREVKELESAGINLTDAQKKAVVMSRLRRRLRRTFQPVKGGSR